mmetsp:Transcript_28369/g.90265  ORF Transcript_28369/g.90265 Transcript_28369/m.90265 type:complete len:461 (+) Transcript_28369:78-1460(+)
MATGPLAMRLAGQRITFAAMALGVAGTLSVLWWDRRRQRRRRRLLSEARHENSCSAGQDAPAAVHCTASRWGDGVAEPQSHLGGNAMIPRVSNIPTHAACPGNCDSADRAAPTVDRRLSADSLVFRPVLPSAGPAKATANVAAGSKVVSSRLRERLAVILTTSPVGRHPSTELIDEVIGSMQLASGLSGCDLIIVCDGYRKENSEGVPYMEPKYRAGIVDAASAVNYEAYKASLRKRSRASCASTPSVRVFELESRHGFGFAVRAALEHVLTPYVIVMQHDRPFTRPVDIPRVLAAMEADPSKFKYVGLPTSTTLGHQYHVLSKYGIRIEPLKVDKCGLQFVPLIQWYDSTHLCETEHYRRFVFGPRRLVARGGFIEDKFGQAELADIRSRGVTVAHHEYGTFLAAGDGFTEPCVGHLDGRDALNASKFRFANTGAAMSGPKPEYAKDAASKQSKLPAKH